MKHVGIITLYRNNRNYGGLLQAYALHRVITHMDNETEIIDYMQNTKAYLISRFLNLGIGRTIRYLYNQMRTKVQKKKNPEYKKNIDIRNTCFKRFEESIPHSKPVNDDDFSEAVKGLDVLVCGSDQVWNPGLWNKKVFLDIEEFDGRRLSYAASIGRDILTTKEKKYIKEHIKRLDYISVRENSAVTLIKPLVNKKVELCLDPTFLLNESEWKRFAIKPEGIPDDFVFLFFLGENESAKKTIHEMFVGKMPIITIPHLQSGYKKEDEDYSDIQLYNIDPHEWVWLISNAKYIFTDSFHATAFSINLHRQFFCFPKGSIKDNQTMNSRLIDLLHLCGIDDRYVDNINHLQKHLDDIIDYKYVEESLQIKRDHSLQYLEKAISE